MKTSIILLSVGLLLSLLSSCKSDSITKDVQIEKGHSQVHSPAHIAENKSYELFNAIYANSYNGDFIDVPSMENISFSSGYINKQQLRSIQKSPAVAPEDVENMLSKGMLKVYQSMKTLLSQNGGMTPSQRDSLLLMANELFGQERIDTESMVWATYLTCYSMKRLESEYDQGLRAYKANKQLADRIGTFVCNLVSGGIGSVWGTMAAGVAMAAGATSTVLTGGVSLVVGLAVSSAIGTIAC